MITFEEVTLARIGELPTANLSIQHTHDLAREDLARIFAWLGVGALKNDIE